MPLSECWVIGQIGLVFGLLILALVFFVSLRQEVRPRSAHGPTQTRSDDIVDTEPARPSSYQVGDQVRTAIGIGKIKRILPDTQGTRTAYSVSFITWPSGIIFREDQISGLDGDGLGRSLSGIGEPRAHGRL